MNEKFKEKMRKAKPLVKPCPFCYGKAKVINDHRISYVPDGDDLKQSFYAFQCESCEAQSHFKGSEKEARKLWNRRGRMDPEAELVSRTRPVKGTKGCILSSGGSEPHFRVYNKHNPPKLRRGVVERDCEFADYYLDLDFLFDLWMEIDDTPMEYKEYLQPDGKKIKILGFTEFAWKGGKKYPELKPGETQNVGKE